MIIVCDVDDVINNLRETTLRMFNSYNKQKYSLDDCTSYRCENTFGKEDSDLMRQIYDGTTVWNYVRPLKGAQDGLRKLIRDGHQVYLVTDAYPYSWVEKFDWIRRYFDFIDTNHIITAKDKWIIKCDVMIEDKVETLIGNPLYDKVCMDYPWNRDVHDEVYNIYRVHNWDEIVDAVNKINSLLT